MLAQLPAGLTFESAVPDLGTYDPGTGQWAVSELPENSHLNLNVWARVDPGTAGSTLTISPQILISGIPDPFGPNNRTSASLTVSNADLFLSIFADDTTPNEGQDVTYFVNLFNNGPDLATGIKVALASSAGLTYLSESADMGSYDSGLGQWSIPSLPEGVLAQLRVVQQIDPGTGGQTLTTLSNIIEVHESDADDLNNTAGIDVVVTSADLAVAAGVNISAPVEGQEVLFAFGLENQGPDAASGTEVTVNLPTGVTYVSDLPGAGSFNSGTGVWTVGSLAASETALLQVTAFVESGFNGSTLTATAAVSAADQSDPDPTNNFASTDIFIGVILSSDLAVALEVDSPTAYESDKVNFSIDLNNNGPDGVTGAQVAVSLPLGLTYFNHTAESGTFDSGTGVWTVGPLSTPGSFQLLLTASVDAGSAGSILTTTAEVSASSLPDSDNLNDIATADVTILSSADLQLTASFDNFNPLPGDTAAMTVVLTNSGPNTASGIAVDLVWSPELTLGSVIPTGGTWDPGSGSWTIPVLASSGTDTLVMNLAVGEVAGGTELTGTAVIGAVNEYDPDLSSDMATATMIVRAVGEVRLVAEPFENSDRALLPGGPEEDILLLAIINDSAAEETLKAITLYNPVTGSFDQATQDAAWAALQLWWEYGEKRVTVPGTNLRFTDGSLTFDDLNLDLKSGETLHLVVRGAASLSAPDGLILEPTIYSGNDLEFSTAVVLEGSWPLVAPGSLCRWDDGRPDHACTRWGPRSSRSDRSAIWLWTYPAANGGVPTSSTS